MLRLGICCNVVLSGYLYGEFSKKWRYIHGVVPLFGEFPIEFRLVGSILVDVDT